MNAGPTKLTVELAPTAVAALDRLAYLAGEGPSESVNRASVNRALRAYAELVSAARHGGGTFFWADGGELVEVVVRAGRRRWWRRRRHLAE